MSDEFEEWCLAKEEEYELRWGEIHERYRACEQQMCDLEDEWDHLKNQHYREVRSKRAALKIPDRKSAFENFIVIGSIAAIFIAYVTFI